MNLERLAMLQDLVLPQLAHCDCMLMDRFVLDWAAVGRTFGAGQHELALLQSIEMMMPVPIIHVFLDTPPEVANSRIMARGETDDWRQGLPYLQGAANAYEAVIPEFVSKLVRVDGTRPTTAIASAVVSHVLALHTTDVDADEPKT